MEQASAEEDWTQRSYRESLHGDAVGIMGSAVVKDRRLDVAEQKHSRGVPFRRIFKNFFY